MRNSILLTSLLLALLNSTSCSSNNELLKLTGRKISFESLDTILYPSNYLGPEDPINGDIKIVTYIYDLTCSTCGIKILQKWQELLKDTGREVSFVVVAHTEAKDEIRMALDELEIDYPVYCDPDDGYIKDNRLFVKAIYRSFLLDCNNKVVLVGEPLNRPELWKLYKQAIVNMSSNGGIYRKEKN